ncbi:MAG TPA: PEP-CTERM sorting domain-containing protein [Roseateles sp.]|uniref:PEP-CTERM sorting domain-containing protein n=1 Tax=Roseateles sp. TaxID=1971397 RepID=UPI002EDAA9FA
MTPDLATSPGPASVPTTAPKAPRFVTNELIGRTLRGRGPRRVDARVKACAAAFALAAGVGSAHASVVSYDSITGHTNSGYALYGGYFAPFDQSGLVGLRFTAGTSGYIDALTIAASGSTPNFSMTLFSDDAGALGSQMQTLAMIGDGVLGGFSSGEFTSGAQLTAGASYWLVLGMDFVMQSWFYMEGSSAPGTGAMAYAYTAGQQLPTSLNYASPTQSLGLRVSIDDGSTGGGTVPEPASYALAGMALFAAFAARRKA